MTWETILFLIVGSIAFYLSGKKFAVQNKVTGLDVLSYIPSLANDTFHFIGNQRFVFDSDGSGPAQNSILSVIPANNTLSAASFLGTVFMQTSPATSVALNVAGSITATGTITASSDERLKKEILPIRNALEKVKKMQGVHFFYKTDEDNESPQYGFVAQDLLKVAPELVKKNTDGYYAVAYGNTTALLVEAIKTQQKQIEELRKDICLLKKKTTDNKTAVQNDSCK